MTFAKHAADDIVDAAEAKNHRLRHLLETAGVLAGTGLAGYGLYRASQNGGTPSDQTTPASIPGHPVANVLNAAGRGAKAVGTAAVDTSRNQLVEMGTGGVAGAYGIGKWKGQTVDGVLREGANPESAVGKIFDRLPNAQGGKLKGLLADAKRSVPVTGDIKDTPLLQQIVAARTGNEPAPLPSGVGYSPVRQFQAYRGMRDVGKSLSWLQGAPPKSSTTLPGGRVINHDDLRTGLAASTAGVGKPGEAAPGMEPEVAGSTLGAMRGAAHVPGWMRLIGGGLGAVGANYLSQTTGLQRQVQ